MKERNWRRDTAFLVSWHYSSPHSPFTPQGKMVTASAGQFFVVNLEILYGVWYFEGQNML